jgi:hypothetical protein
MEEIMQLYTITELMHLTRDELCDLAADLERVLREFEPGTVVRLRTPIDLDNIRRVMVMRGLHY